MYNNKKIIRINGDTNEWYEQVIFILRKDIDNEKNLITNAEEFIELCYDQSINNKKVYNLNKNYKKNANKMDFEITLNYIMLMCCFIFIFGIFIILN